LKIFLTASPGLPQYTSMLFSREFLARKMAIVAHKTYFRNDKWKEDTKLREDLVQYISQGLRRHEILDFLERDYRQYTWSLRSLDRRCKYFRIQRHDEAVTIDQLRSAVKNELDGPGKLLGYRAMHAKIRQEYHLHVPRHAVHNVMYDLDAEGLENRALANRKRKRLCGNFMTKGPNWVHSLDGHAKLMGYQKSTFPLAIYGCLDSASRKLLWLKIWTTNSDPKIIGRWYFEHLYETKVIAQNLRIDKGTETGEMSTMHAFLMSELGAEDPVSSVVFGPSTSNQVKQFLVHIHIKSENRKMIPVTLLICDYRSRI